MELGTFPLMFILLTTFLLAMLLSPVSGKCHGKWAIHACFGGNGKRSDPNFDTNVPVPSNVASRIRARLEDDPRSGDKLMAVLRSNFRSQRERPSRHEGPGYRISQVHSKSNSKSEAGLIHRLLFTDVARLIQEDELSREKAAASPPEGVFSRDSAGDQKVPVEPFDIDALRSLVAALKLEHELRREESSQEDRSADDTLL